MSPSRAAVILAAMIALSVAFPVMAENFWLPPAATVQLPELKKATLTPNEWAISVQGKTGVPQQAGTYVLYNHGHLWYWFGPYSDARSATRGLAVIRGIWLELKSRNRPRYADALIRKLTIDKNDDLKKIAESQGGIDLALLLETLGELEHLTTVKESLEREMKAIKPAAVQRPLIAGALRTRALEVAVGPTPFDAAPRSVYFVGSEPVLDAQRSFEVRREVGLRILGNDLPQDSLERIIQGKTTPSDLVRLKLAGDKFLERGNGQYKEEWRGRVESAREDPKPGTAAQELITVLGELGMAALLYDKPQGELARLEQVPRSSLDAFKSASIEKGLPTLAQVAADANRKLKTPNLKSSPAPVDTDSSAIMLDALDRTGFTKTGADGEEAARRIDRAVDSSAAVQGASFADGSVTGLRPSAVRDLTSRMQQFLEKYADKTKARSAHEQSQGAFAAGFADSLRQEVGIVPAADDQPLTAAQERALRDAYERRSGKELPLAPGQKAGKSLGQASQQLAADAAAGKTGMTANDVRNVARRGAEGGNDGGTGPNRAGSGSLRGHMPLFELFARYLASQLGIDPALAKNILMLAYALDPKTFESLAAELEALHGRLISKDLSRNLTDLNKALEILGQLEAQYQKIESKVSKLLEQGVEKVLEDMARRGAESLTRHAMDELAKKLGIDPKVLQVVQNLPKDFDADRFGNQILTLGKGHVRQELERRGLSPDLLADDPQKRRAAGRQWVDAQMANALAKNGIDAAAWRAIKQGDASAASQLLRDSAHRELRNWAGKVGFTSEETAQLVGAAGKDAVQFLRDVGTVRVERAFEHARRNAVRDLAHKAGFDDSATTRLASTSAAALPEVFQVETARRLQREYDTARSGGTASIRRWAIEEGLTAEEAKSLSQATPENALEALRSNGVARAQRAFDAERRRQTSDWASKAGFTKDEAQALSTASGAGLPQTVNALAISMLDREYRSAIKSGRARLQTWSRDVGLPEEAAKRLAEGDAAQAAAVLQIAGEQQIGQALVTAQGIPEISAALAAMQDPQRARAPIEQRLQQDFGVSEAFARALVSGDLSSISQDRFQEELWTAGQKWGWQRLAKLISVDAAELRAYAQSPGYFSTLQKTVRDVPASMSSNVSAELHRQKGLIDLEIARRKQEVTRLSGRQLSH